MSAKRNFSSFNVRDAFQKAQITELNRWTIDVPDRQPSDFFHQRMERLEQTFDLTFSEHARELLIDAICEEALTGHKRVKIWKAAPLQSDDMSGTADYLLAPKKGYLDTPLLCVVEAKKDDFEKGLAQCLVEMLACQWSNQQQLGHPLDIYGIVTNGSVWVFYKLTLAGEVLETLPYSINNLAQVLGALSYVFAECEKNL